MGMNILLGQGQSIGSGLNLLSGPIIVNVVVKIEGRHDDVAYPCPRCSVNISSGIVNSLATQTAHRKENVNGAV